MGEEKEKGGGVVVVEEIMLKEGVGMGGPNANFFFLNRNQACRP